jgi:hypothetical protein
VVAVTTVAGSPVKIDTVVGEVTSVALGDVETGGGRGIERAATTGADVAGCEVRCVDSVLAVALSAVALTVDVLVGGPVFINLCVHLLNGFEQCLAVTQGTPPLFANVCDSRAENALRRSTLA